MSMSGEHGLLLCILYMQRKGKGGADCMHGTKAVTCMMHVNTYSARAYGGMSAVYTAT